MNGPQMNKPHLICKCPRSPMILMGFFSVFFITCLEIQAAEPGQQYCQQADSVVDVLGIAQSESGETLYCELHSDSDNGTQSVEYYWPNGEKIADKVYSNLSEPGLVHFTQWHYLHDEIRSVSLDGDLFTVHFRRHDNATRKNKEFSLSEVDIIDAGFDDWVRAHWERLTNGEAMTVNFLSPPHLKTFKLKVSVSENCASDRYCFRIAPASSLLRLFAPDINLEYNEQQQLVQFRGITNITDDKGKSYKATIHYFYEEHLRTAYSGPLTL